MEEDILDELVLSEMVASEVLENAIMEGSVKKTSPEVEEDFLEEFLLSELFQIPEEDVEYDVLKDPVKKTSSEVEEDFLEEFLLSELFYIPGEDVEYDLTKDQVNYQEFDFMSGATCGSDVHSLMEIEELENVYFGSEIEEDTDTFGGPSSSGAVNTTPSPDLEESDLQRSEESTKKLGKPYPNVKDKKS